MDQTSWVTIIVALVGGGGLKAGYDILRDMGSGRARARRAEVDHMATLLAESNARARVAERRARIATELMHETRVVALAHGVRSVDLPPVDFKDTK
ncbi:hypothetical protein ACXR2W_00725 [Leucobacter sp. HY1908]